MSDCGTVRVVKYIPLLLISSLAFSAFAGQNRTAPAFDGKTTLLRPADYREWIFVGSSLGLSYRANAADNEKPGREIYHNVYIKPEAYREFAKTGRFPEGTMMVLETLSSETKREPGLQGSYENEFANLEISVKDSSRFDGGWAYYDFSNGKTKSEPFPASAGCVGCHKQNAQTDNVFTQFYPILRALKK